MIKITIIIVVLFSPDKFVD